MESKTTSKTSSLQALLLRAWRERWSDLQWGIKIKTVLPRGVSGDVYNLADCILQQAVVGAGANQLVLSYLKHSLSAQLVSHAAVLSQISKFQQLHKTHCVSSLLDFIEGVLPGVTCCGKSEETKLAGALLATTIWLLEIATKVPSLLTKVIAILKPLLATPFYLAMVYLARFSEPERFLEMQLKCSEILDKECKEAMDVESGEALPVNISDQESTSSASVKVVSDGEQSKELRDFVDVLKDIEPATLATGKVVDKGPQALIQAWLAVRLIENPGCGTTELAHRLRLLQRLAGMSDARLACEIMRGSLLSLSNVSQTQYEIQWGAFVFLKLPRVLQQLSLASESIREGLDLLVLHSPLLDAMDAPASCSSLDCLLGELVKAALITEAQAEVLNTRRRNSGRNTNTTTISPNTGNTVSASTTSSTSGGSSPPPPLGGAAKVTTTPVGASSAGGGSATAVTGGVTSITSTGVDAAVSTVASSAGGSVTAGGVATVAPTVTAPTVLTGVGIPKVIICAEPTLARILKTLTTDYLKTPDSLLGMLHKVLAGNSFELILAVATVQGQLGTLVQRLIRFNECSKLAATSDPRAQLFDISFIMLVAIVQNYGVTNTLTSQNNTAPTTTTNPTNNLNIIPGTVNLSNTNNSSTSANVIAMDTTSSNSASSGITMSTVTGDSLLERWVTSCMVEVTRPKAADQLLRLCDTGTVARLLRQFNAGESDVVGEGGVLSTVTGASVTGVTEGGEAVTGGGGGAVDWGEVLFSMGGVMKEVLVAWEQGALCPADVKRILDSVRGGRGRMCCLPLAAAAWLCSYMRTAPQHTLLKPGNMLHQLLVLPDNQQPEDDSLRQRWQLTREVICRMQADIQLPLQQTASDRHLVSGQPARKEVRGVWMKAIERGWLDVESARRLHCLVETAGARWLVTALLQELLQLRYRDQLARGCDVALAAFHVNIRACCVQLLTHALPQLLHYSLQTDSLMEPQLSTVAQLTARVIYAAIDDLDNDTNTLNNHNTASLSQTSTNTTAIPTTTPPPSKRPKLTTLAPPPQLSSTVKGVIEDPAVILTALHQLLLGLERHMQSGFITQQTYFTCHLLHALVDVTPVVSDTNTGANSSSGGSSNVGKVGNNGVFTTISQQQRTVLSVVPAGLVSQLLCTLPELFSAKFLVQLYDVATTQGRASMARDLCIVRNYQLREH